MHTAEVYELWAVTFIALGSAGPFCLESLIAVPPPPLAKLHCQEETLPVSCLEAKNLTLCLGNQSGEQYKCLKTQYVNFPFPLGWEGPLEVEMATHYSILARESHGQRRLAGYHPWGQTQLSD